MNIFINNYLKNITIEKAILISKQLCINFSTSEMQFVLPYLKNNWQNLLDDRKKLYLLKDISCKTSIETAKKTDALLNKLLIIFS